MAGDSWPSMARCGVTRRDKAGLHEMTSGGAGETGYGWNGIDVERQAGRGWARNGKASIG